MPVKKSPVHSDGRFFIMVEQKFSKPGRIQGRASQAERFQVDPNGPERRTKFISVDGGFLVKRTIYKLTIVDQYDLMTLFRFIDKYVFEHAQITQVRNFCFDLFKQLATNGFIAALTKFDRAPQWTVKYLLLDRVKTFTD